MHTEIIILIIPVVLELSWFDNAYKSKSILIAVTVIKAILALFNKNTNPKPSAKNAIANTIPTIPIIGVEFLNIAIENKPDMKVNIVIICNQNGVCFVNLSIQPLMCFFEILFCFNAHAKQTGLSSTSM